LIVGVAEILSHACRRQGMPDCTESAESARSVAAVGLVQDWGKNADWITIRYGNAEMTRQFN